MATCNGCGAAIDFVLMRTGKKMPADAKRTAVVVDSQGPLKFVTDTGELISARVATDADGAFPIKIQHLRAPHWAACPARDRFKAKGRTAP